jgi:hypothetical protein
MRLKACIEAGLTEVQTIQALGLTEDQKKEFIVKDNVGFGEWDWDDLANNWEIEQLTEWGLDIPNFNIAEEKEEKEHELELSWFLNIRCTDETNAQSLYEKFIAEGLDVKIVN